MKKTFRIFLLTALVATLWLTLDLTDALTKDAFSPMVTLRTDHIIIDNDLPRYGLNLGGNSSWGAEHLRANLLANPGFEAVLDRTFLISREASMSRLIDNAPWLSRPENFWDGGTFNIRTGHMAGTEGRIIHSSQAERGGMQLMVDSPLKNIFAGDVVVLTREADTTGAPMWWKGHSGKVVVSRDTRPASPGQQSVMMIAGAGERAELLHYFDTITERAGKLLLINGQWQLSLWGRAKKADVPLRIYFGREGAHPFLEQECVLQIEWTQCSFNFEAKDNGPAGVLTFGLSVTHATVILDDVYLGEANASASGFRRDVITTLKALNPGYLRDWQGQLGDTLSNRVASEFEHQPVRYRPGDNEIQFHYGLEDFFSLCAEIGARPWVVAPTTLHDQEWNNLGVYLRDAADRYEIDEILVEFGNENWNQIFRPAGISDVARHAELADRSFRLLRQGSRDDQRIIFVVNAQYVNPDDPQAIAAASSQAQRVAVAPYLVNYLDQTKKRHSAHQKAFLETADLLEQEVSLVQSRQKKLAVYEVNFHSTWGSADTELRNEVVTGAASGPALARRLMQATLAGVREQGVYRLSGFDSYLSENLSLVRLWGITRDLREAEHFRPTGIALAMLNRVASGKTAASKCSGIYCSDITAVSYQDGTAWAIVSSSTEPRQIKLNHPCHNGMVTIDLLDGSDPARSNETTTQVNSQRSMRSCSEGQLFIELPAHSLMVLSE